MNTGIHDATVATTYNGYNSLLELQAFLAATESMVAGGGGDGPERQLQALLATLVVEYEGHPVMIPGSEIVLLTDAPAHDAELLEDVVIAKAKFATVVNSIDRSSFRRFDEEHDYGQCARFYNLTTFIDRKKRAVSTSSYGTEQRCHYFTTSLLTDTLTVHGYTAHYAMIVTKPNGEEVNIINFGGDKVYHDTAPLSGQWSVCVQPGTLSISVDVTDSISPIGDNNYSIR